MFKQTIRNFLKSDNVFFTFMRSTVSSQICSWTDMILSFVLYAWVHLMPWLATALGAVAGGILNCIIGYRFTYHADGVSKKAVVVKFALVWLGSLILNSWGTEALFRLFDNWTWLTSIGFKHDGCFAAARLIVSLVVSLAWNFLLQRKFVYRPTSFDPWAIKFINAISPK